MLRKLKGLAVLAGLILCLWLAKPFWLPAVARFLMVSDRDLEPADVIIVLSGEFGERVNTGVKLYEEGLAPRLLMTGGPVEWYVTAAEIMERQALSLGVPAGDIIMEPRATSTYENALYSYEIVKKSGWRSAIVVTSPYHLRRTRIIFNRVFDDSIRLQFYGAENPWLEPDRWWLQGMGGEKVILEYFKLAWYLLHY